jgi:hypothetical protein
MADPKRSTATPDEAYALRSNPRFVPPECYSTISPEQNEVGALVEMIGEPSLQHGMWVQQAVYVERFFLETQC